MYTAFLWKILKEADHLENPNLVWRIILKCNLPEVEREVMDCIALASDRDRWPRL
jgi:hypothetical protein